MIRKTMKLLLIAILAAITLSSTAEAAQKKTVRHRPKHSSRVTASAASVPAAVKKSKAKRRASKSTTAKKSTATKRVKATAKRKPTTKPR